MACGVQYWHVACSSLERPETAAWLFGADRAKDFGAQGLGGACWLPLLLMERLEPTDPKRSGEVKTWPLSPLTFPLLLRLGGLEPQTKQGLKTSATDSSPF